MAWRMRIRDEAAADALAVSVLLEAAFSGPDEARLVERLREAGDIAFALVAEESGAVVGHILFSPMAAPFRALALAPVAVVPERQGEGIGSALVREGLERAKAAGWKGVFVVGEPAYYRRFGFDSAMAAGFDSPYAGPYLMVLPLGGGPLPSTFGAIEHAPAFAALS